MIEEEMLEQIVEEITTVVDEAEIENDSGLKPMTEDDIQNIAQDAVTDAIDFVESEIAEDRIKAQRYFDGEVDFGE